MNRVDRLDRDMLQSPVTRVTTGIESADYADYADKEE
jgi:hypothetical protein